MALPVLCVSSLVSASLGCYTGSCTRRTQLNTAPYCRDEARSGTPNACCSGQGITGSMLTLAYPFRNPARDLLRLRFRNETFPHHHRSTRRGGGDKRNMSVFCRSLATCRDCFGMTPVCATPSRCCSLVWLPSTYSVLDRRTWDRCTYTYVDPAPATA